MSRANPIRARIASRIRHYGVSVIAVTVAIVARLALLHVLNLHSPFLLLFAAVMLSSAYGGLGPGIVATGLSALGSGLFIDDDARDFSDFSIFCLEGFFLSVVGAMFHRARQRARLADTAARKLEQKILEISEEERRRIGHDLHDGLGQHLTGIALLVKGLKQRLLTFKESEAQQAERIAVLVNQSIEWTRDLARGLSPVTLESGGLQPALEELAANASNLLGINCICNCMDAELLSDGEAGMHLYRIAQEAVNNSVKHGKARNVVIGLQLRNGSLDLTVRDDGSGLSHKTRTQPGIGLQIMDYRARMIGGTISVSRAATGGGTVVTCTVPLPKADSAGA